MKMIKLKVNEIFGPTIQGEGKTCGEKCVFLRLAGCNLHCIWCDSPYTWNWKDTDFKHPKKYDRNAERHEVDADTVAKELIVLDRNHNYKRLVITGGEPLLQQRQLIPLLQQLKSLDWTIEVETNGTIYPDQEFTTLIDQYNISPKLENSGNTLEERRNQKALQFFSLFKQAYFKFVIASKRDLEEVLNMFITYKIPPNHIYLMPLGKTQAELNASSSTVAELCIQHEFKFSPRLQITIWGDKRKV